MSNQNLSFKDKVVIVTGGTSGIGKSTALALAHAGAHVITCGRHKDSIHEMDLELQKIDKKSRALVADVTHAIEVDELFNYIDENFGTLDIMINNAGLPANSVFNTPLKEWQGIINVNLVGYMYCTKLAAERMKKQGHGHIINIGSLCIDVYDAGADIYVATKAAVEGFTHSVRKLLAKDHVRVSLINPGAVRSGMVIPNEHEKQTGVYDVEMLKPEDVTSAIMWCIEQPKHVDVTELNIRIHNQSNL